MKAKKKDVKEAIIELAKHVPFAVNIMSLLDNISELERLAEIGRATEKVFEKTEVAMFVSYWTDDFEEKYIDMVNSFSFDSVEELLDWAKED